MNSRQVREVWLIHGLKKSSSIFLLEPDPMGDLPYLPARYRCHGRSLWDHQEAPVIALGVATRLGKLQGREPLPVTEISAQIEHDTLLQGLFPKLQASRLILTSKPLLPEARA
jgi:hypothetical protein